MLRALILGSTALVFVSAAPALAGGVGGKKLTGLGDVGYNYLELDDGSFDSIDTFHGRGSALWTWPGKWNAQGNFEFGAGRLEDSGPSYALNNWRLGAGLFYREESNYMLGGELHYQSFDFAVPNDGIDLTGRGELYFPQTTLGAYLGYSSIDGSYVDADGWKLGGYGTYYAEPQTALKLGVNYGTWDVSSNDLDDWSINGELEYLIPDCTTSIYGGLGFGWLDNGSGNDANYWTIGAGLRVHFGTSGDLSTRNRNEPLTSLGTQFRF